MNVTSQMEVELKVRTDKKRERDVKGLEKQNQSTITVHIVDLDGPS